MTIATIRSTMCLRAASRTLQRVESCSNTITSTRQLWLRRQSSSLQHHSNYTTPIRSAVFLPNSSSSSSHAFHTTAAQRNTMGHNNERVPDQAPTTDFGRMDMLGQTPTPSTSVDVCMHDGFAFNSGVHIDGGDGALLVGGEAFAWRPWREGHKLLNAKGQWDLPAEALGLLGLVWPRPDLLIIGMGKEIRPMSPETKRLISSLGMRVDILDTRNAASQFNLLATERGVDNVAAALIPIGWREGVGAEKSS
ncbi:hypothetical protein B0T17DRAFT_521081 [Bombardia bombarda]|uniref:NADH dehydrogenase [ubiquinone] 1 alpha subcomplex assembly factor 3 n=1 Tax=Bombardia bombarda TaxID=252184 RepID=A0AA40CH21_9PEZI|nr:hypothetical protein B0T17DRAFT_521081 [Bombardia bombarda]